jgi:uncharacterized protein
MTRDAKYWIEKLELVRHPEGGYYRETYRSSLPIPQNALPTGFGGPRLASTAIYFLVDGSSFSALHRIKSDELWHFYAGDPLVVHVIDAAGNYSEILLGDKPEFGQVFQGVVAAGCWFGCRLREQEGCALVGCTVAPGFDFEDFELGKRSELVAEFPQHRELIEQLTR